MFSFQCCADATTTRFAVWISSAESDDLRLARSELVLLVRTLPAMLLLLPSIPPRRHSASRTLSCLQGRTGRSLLRWYGTAIIACSQFTVLAGSFFSLPRKLLGADFVNVTVHHSDVPVEASPFLTRLQRCFIQGSQMDSVRRSMRVLAGVRPHDGDAKRLTEDELKAVLEHAPAQSRCALACFACVHHNQLPGCGSTRSPSRVVSPLSDRCL
jgi:hypothetical protein